MSHFYIYNIFSNARFILGSGTVDREQIGEIFRHILGNSVRGKHKKAKPFIPSQGQIIPVEKFKKIIRSRIVALTGSLRSYYGDGNENVTKQ